MKKMMVVMAALSLAVIGACGGGDGGGGGTSTACGTETQGCITGNVIDATTQTWSEGAAAPTLSVNGGAAVTANTQGYFFVKEIAQGATLPVCFSATGYATRCRNITVTGGETLQMTPTALMPMGNAETKAAGVGTFGNTGTSGQFTAVAGDFCDAGTPVTGNVTCSLTPLDVSARQDTVAGNNLSLAPGSFTGTQADGTSTQLVSGGMMDIYCTNDAGTRLQVCAGKTPTVQIPIYDADCANATKYPASMKSWGFDEATGQWVEYATFAKTCGTGVTDSFYTGVISHLSYWNCDMPMQTTCVTGRVIGVDGVTPVSGARVSCTGVDYNGESEVYTGADGTFCAPVMTGGAYSCVARVSAFVSNVITGTASATAAQCGGEGCTAIGDFTLTKPLLATILTWGVSPSDLDSHFAWAGDDIYFGKDINPHVKELFLGKMGSLTSAPFIALDTDDTTSYGPEITSVVPGVEANTYRFCVHNYSGQSSGPMEASGAVVNVISSTFNKSYPIPTSNPNNGDVWRVYQVVLNADGTMSFTDLNDFVSSESGGVAAACLQ